MNTTAPLLVEQRGRIRWLRLSRPGQRNALNADLIAALDEQVTIAEADPADRSRRGVRQRSELLCRG
jgi:enoyl-CoA hydratase/carnithine racemase